MAHDSAPPGDTGNAPPGEMAECARQGAKAAARGDASSTNPFRSPTGPSAPMTVPGGVRGRAWQAGYDAQASVVPSLVDDAAAGQGDEHR